jgi:hypothetical protein
MAEEEGVYLRYIDKKLGEEALKVIDGANAIIEEYQQQGLDLTLRQLYYQFVARGWIANKQSEYNRLGTIISDGRLCGLVRWDALVDRTRNLMGLETYDSPRKVLQAAADGYKRDLWREQTWRPEVWIEKEALTGVVSQICNELRVDFFACRGYNSQSEQWRAGRRFSRYIRNGQRPIIFHLGDHDPSGIDMTRDNADRLEMFVGTPVSVQRLALNMDQIEELKPPPNPTKLSDSRAAAYVERFGDESWELDALDPSYIRNLISNAVGMVRDNSVWEDSLSEELGEIEQLKAMAKEFGA